MDEGWDLDEEDEEEAKGDTVRLAAALRRPSVPFPAGMPEENDEDEDDDDEDDWAELRDDLRAFFASHVPAEDPGGL